MLSKLLVTEVEQVLTLLLISAAPFVELRGSIPFGAAVHVPFLENLIISVIGNMLPVPIIILFVRKLFEWMRKKKLFKRQIDWAERHVLSKRGVIQKYELIGLAILVAIPLPGTGAWTGAMLAGLLDMRLRTALPAIFIGVVIAGILVCGVAYGFIGFLSFII